MPLALPPGFSLSIICPDHTSAVNMLDVAVPPDASVTLERCQVTTVSLAVASRELDLGAFAAPFLGLDGSLFCDDCRMLFSNTVRPLLRRSRLLPLHQRETMGVRVMQSSSTVSQVYKDVAKRLCTHTYSKAGHSFLWLDICGCHV